MSTRQHSPPRQRGIVLISSLLLLLVVTIMAVAIFRNFGMQEKIAGNEREKQLALHAAESAQQYAEWWLSSNNNSSTLTVCNALVNANAGFGQVCSNTLQASVANVATVPWKIGGADVGVTYTPPNPATGALMALSTTGGVGTYYATPRFYISYLGAAVSGAGSVFQIDSVGYGGSSNSVAVVESTYLVTTGVKNLGGL